MKILTKDFIVDKLSTKYKEQVKKYGENSILGVFVVGNANYGYAEKESEIKYVTIYLPTFAELCTTTGHNSNNDIYDIRRIYTATIDPIQCPLELLFTDYYIITPKYRELFEQYFLNNREKIANYNKELRIRKAYHRMQVAFSNNDVFEAVRLSVAATMFAKGISCNECFHISDPVYEEYLWSCKHDYAVVDREKILTNVENILDKLETTTNYDIDSLIKTGVIELIKTALTNNISLDAFISCLTPTEQKAWEILESKIVDGTVSISISKIIEETKISRPVWTSLLKKLEMDKVAIVESQGVKGTFIKLIN